MPRGYSTGKRDANEPGLRQMAAAVFPNAEIICQREGQGFDWLVVTEYGNHIVEVKMPGTYKLTDKEAETKSAVERAGGVYWIWQTDDDVIKTKRHYAGTFVPDDASKGW